jgi:hypothetical protein
MIRWFARTKMSVKVKLGLFKSKAEEAQQRVPSNPIPVHVASALSEEPVNMLVKLETLNGRSLVRCTPEVAGAEGTPSKNGKSRKRRRSSEDKATDKPGITRPCIVDEKVFFERLARSISRYGNLYDLGYQVPHRSKHSSLCPPKKLRYLDESDLIEKTNWNVGRIQKLALEFFCDCEQEEAAFHQLDSDTRGKYSEISRLGNLFKAKKIRDDVIDNTKLFDLCRKQRKRRQKLQGTSQNPKYIVPGLEKLPINLEISGVTPWKWGKEKHEWEDHHDLCLLSGVWKHGIDLKNIRRDSDLLLSKFSEIPDARLKERIKSLLKVIPLKAHISMPAGKSKAPVTSVLEGGIEKRVTSKSAPKKRKGHDSIKEVETKPIVPVKHKELASSIQKDGCPLVKKINVRSQKDNTNPVGSSKKISPKVTANAIDSLIGSSKKVSPKSTSNPVDSLVGNANKKSSVKEGGKGGSKSISKFGGVDAGLLVRKNITNSIDSLVGCDNQNSTKGGGKGGGKTSSKHKKVDGVETEMSIPEKAKPSLSSPMTKQEAALTDPARLLRPLENTMKKMRRLPKWAEDKDEETVLKKVKPPLLVFSCGLT